MVRSEHGFTILELITTIGILGFLMASITFVYTTCVKSYNAGQDRARVRTQLSQTMELMTRELIKATAIATCNENTLTFTADLGTGTQLAYTYELYSTNDANGGSAYGASGHSYLANTSTPSGSLGSYNLTKRLDSASFGSGVMKASDIESPTAAGGVPIFSCSNGEVTIDVTALNYGETVHMQTKVKSRNIPQGLVAWWKLDDASSGTTQSTAVDSTGNGNTGSLQNSPTWTSSGQISNALILASASSQSVSVAHSTSLNVADTISISAWIKVSSHNSSYREIVRKDNGGDGWFFLLNGSNKLSMTTSSQSSEYDNGFSYSADGLWHLVTGTFDGTTIKLYLDDGLQTSFAGGTLKQNSDTLYLGSLSGSGQFFNGSMDDVRIYNRALTAAEVAEVYNQGHGTY